MTIAALQKDQALVPTAAKEPEKSARRAFIAIRVRRRLEADATLRDPSNASDIADAAMAGMATNLASEMGRIPAAVTDMSARVTAAAASHIDLATVDPRISDRLIQAGIAPGSLSALRSRTVMSIVWRAVAHDITQLDSANASRLAHLVHRRLHLVERMMYQVTTTHVRSFPKSIPAGGSWPDGWTRMFEYPRVPYGTFLSVCNPPAASGAVLMCSATGMQDWYVIPGNTEAVHHATMVRPVALGPWINVDTNGIDEGATGFDTTDLTLYEKRFDRDYGLPPADAVHLLFVADTNYRARNLMYCDQVIQSLHVEAMLFAYELADPDTQWFTDYVDGYYDDSNRRWLRIYTPWSSGPGVLPYIVQEDGKLFEHAQIHVDELQVGDHLIVYNHPAYDRVAPGGVWRLENALVVKADPGTPVSGADPGILMQGHGTDPETMAVMKSQMIRLFNKALAARRSDVLAHIATGSTANITIGSTASIVLRYAPANSMFAGAAQKADWWVAWTLKSDDRLQDAAASADWSQLLKNAHKIEFAHWPTPASEMVCFFPLWVAPTTSGTGYTDSSGKFIKADEVRVTADMVDGWTWVTPTEVSERAMVSVIRPKTN